MKHIKLFEDYSNTTEDYLNYENDPDISSLGELEKKYYGLSIDDNFDSFGTFRETVGRILLDAYKNPKKHGYYLSIPESTEFFIDKQIAYLNHYGYLYIDSEDDEIQPKKLDQDDLKSILEEVTDFSEIPDLRNNKDDEPSLEEFFEYFTETMLCDDGYEETLYEFFTNANDEFIRVYRQIRVNRKFIKEISNNTEFKTSFGEYWSFIYLEDDSSWSPDTDGVPIKVTVEALVHSSSINWFATVLENLSIPDECSIDLVPNSNIIIESIKIEDEIEIDLDDYTSLKAKV